MDNNQNLSQQMSQQSATPMENAFSHFTTPEPEILDAESPRLGFCRHQNPIEDISMADSHAQEETSEDAPRPARTDIFSQFSAPVSEVADTLPPDLIPCRHQNPIEDISMADSHAQEETSEDAPRPARIDIFSQFSAPVSEVADTLPPDLIPCRHQEPVRNDPSVSFPSWGMIFRADLNLTDAKEGLRSQKVNRNIAEIANAIHNRYEFMSISGQLAVYKPPSWRIMHSNESLRFVRGAVDELFPADAQYLNRRQYEEIVSHLLHDRRTTLLQMVPPLDDSYLCCRDCMYDWRAGTCHPHSSSFRRFSYLNLDAESIGNCDGTLWEQFLGNLTDGDAALRQRILEMIGVILSGYPSKSFFFLQGESGTGKTQLVNFLRDVLGDSACVALNDVSQLGQKWTTGSIFGKLLCLCGDMPDAPLDSKTIGTIKQLTGEDLIRGVFKYKDAFMFENTAKLLFVSNYPLQIPNQQREEALLERLVVIPCLNPIPKEGQIPSLHKLLYENAGYVVHLAMEALIDFDSRNGIFTPLPETFVSATVQSPDKERAVWEFVQDHLILDESASCLVSDVFQLFQTYHPEANLCAAQFSKLLYRLYPQVVPDRSKTARKYCGLRLIDDSGP